VQQCTLKYSLEVYYRFCELFDCLPLAALVTTDDIGQFFCCHGGIGPDLSSPQDVMRIDRFQEVPKSGNYCDLLWADPIPEGDAVGLPERQLETWYNTSFKKNDARGISFMMYYQAPLAFCNNNKISSIIRGHEVQKYGYYEHRYRKREREHPLIMTIFSAPNYCDMYENRGAFLKLSHSSYDFVDVGWVDHPYVLPDFQNVFAFSLPFIAENIYKFCMNILSLCNDAEPEDDSRNRLKTKIRNLGRVMVALKLKRMDSESKLLPLQIKFDNEEDRFEKVKQADHLEYVVGNAEETPAEKIE